MSVQYTIAITKDILHQSKNCGVNKDVHETATHCAIAIALKDIFPLVYVNNFYIFPFGIENNEVKDLKIGLPLIARQFVKLFDGFSFAPRLRLMLPEFEFTIDIPDEIINVINIDEVKSWCSPKHHAMIN